jgi:hypothetical protein
MGEEGGASAVRLGGEQAEIGKRLAGIPSESGIMQAVCGSLPLRRVDEVADSLRITRRLAAGSRLPRSCSWRSSRCSGRRCSGSRSTRCASSSARCCSRSGCNGCARRSCGRAASNRCTTRTRPTARSARAAAAGQEEKGPLDWYSFTVAFKGVLLEGLEIVFIVIAFGTAQNSAARATAPAGAAGRS